MPPRKMSFDEMLRRQITTNQRAAELDAQLKEFEPAQIEHFCHVTDASPEIVEQAIDYACKTSHLERWHLINALEAFHNTVEHLKGE